MTGHLFLSEYNHKKNDANTLQGILTASSYLSLDCTFVILNLICKLSLLLCNGDDSVTEQRLIFSVVYILSFA